MHGLLLTLYLSWKLSTFSLFELFLNKIIFIHSLLYKYSRQTHRHLISRNKHEPTCGNAACGKQRLTITLPTRLLLMKGETQYLVWHRDTTRKGVWDGEDDEVPKEERVVWGNIELTGSWRGQQAVGSVL